MATKKQTAAASQSKDQVEANANASSSAQQGDAAAQLVTTTVEAAKEAAEAETAKAAAENRLPENTAVTNPAPAATMDPASGAFVEPAILEGVPADHPSVENNPRKATSAVQNGQDFNDPIRDPDDPAFVGQGLDLSVYGDRPKK